MIIVRITLQLSSNDWALQNKHQVYDVMPNSHYRHEREREPGVVKGSVGTALKTLLHNVSTFKDDNEFTIFPLLHDGTPVRGVVQWREQSSARLSLDTSIETPKKSRR